MAGALVAGVGLFVSTVVTRKTHENEQVCTRALKSLEDVSKKLESIPDRDRREELTLRLANMSEALTKWSQSWFPNKLRVPSLNEIDELIIAIEDAVDDEDAVALPILEEE